MCVCQCRCQCGILYICSLLICLVCNLSYGIVCEVIISRRRWVLPGFHTPTEKEVKQLLGREENSIICPPLLLTDNIKCETTV